jgi:hypothetical protein
MCVIVDEKNQVVGSATRKETGEQRLQHGTTGMPILWQNAAQLTLPTGIN